MKKQKLTPEREVTLQELWTFLMDVDAYSLKYKEERSPLTWGLYTRLKPKLIKEREHFKDEMTSRVRELEVRLASLKEGNLIENRFDLKSRGSEETQIRYAYTAEKKIELDKAIANINNEYRAKTIKIQPFIVDIPKNFDFQFYESFKKFVFEELPEEKELELYLSQNEEKKESNNGTPTITPVLEKV